jgi:hypothetical protein
VLQLSELVEGSYDDRNQVRTNGLVEYRHDDHNQVLIQSLMGIYLLGTSPTGITGDQPMF